MVPAVRCCCSRSALVTTLSYFRSVRWHSSTQPEAIEQSSSLWSSSSKKRPRLEALRQRLQETEKTKEKTTLAPFGRPTVTRTSGTKNAMASNKQQQQEQHNELKTLQDWNEFISHIPDPPEPASHALLTDRFQRQHTYLRLSLTERCNFRCTYCMPLNGVSLSPADRLLSSGELLRLSRLFVAHGVNKVRLTGGEPTLRGDLVDIVAGLKQLCLPDNSMQSPRVGVTTNGLILSRLVPDLVQAGLDSINLSLDTLRRDKFAQMRV